MARGRLLEGRISTSEKLDALYCRAEEIAPGLGEFAQKLWTWAYLHCDDFGRFHNTPKKVWAIVNPYSNRPMQDFQTVIDLWHEPLAGGPLNEKLADKDGHTCTYFVGFEETQGSYLRKRTKPKHLPLLAHNHQEVPGSSGKFPPIGSGSGSGSCSVPDRVGSGKSSSQENENFKTKQYEISGKVVRFGQEWKSNGQILKIDQHNERPYLWSNEPVIGWKPLRPVKSLPPGRGEV